MKEYMFMGSYFYIRLQVHLQVQQRRMSPTNGKQHSVDGILQMVLQYFPLPGVSTGQ